MCSEVHLKVYSNIMHNSDSSHESCTALWPAQGPHNLLSNGYWVKRPEREINHSPQFSAKLKNAWSYTSTPPYVLMARCLIETKATFILNFLQLTWRYRLLGHADAPLKTGRTCDASFCFSINTTIERSSSLCSLPDPLVISSPLTTPWL